jgi:hypothetical protein
MTRYRSCVISLQRISTNSRRIPTEKCIRATGKKWVGRRHHSSEARAGHLVHIGDARNGTASNGRTRTLDGTQTILTQ